MIHFIFLGNNEFLQVDMIPPQRKKKSDISLRPLHLSSVSSASKKKDDPSSESDEDYVPVSKKKSAPKKKLATRATRAST